MPSQALASPPRILTSCASTRRVVRPRCPLTFARFSRAQSSFALALTATLACHPLRTPQSDHTLATRARLIRLEDTRVDEPRFLDSLLEAGDPALRRGAALAAGRLAAKAHLPALRHLALDPDPMIADAAYY